MPLFFSPNFRGKLLAKYPIEFEITHPDKWIAAKNKTAAHEIVIKSQIP